MPRKAINLPWDNIHTLLLDMDGTLLDLHFDSYFWKEYIPLKYGEKHGLDIITSKQILNPRFRAAEKTLDWYCLDYWTKALNIDVALLKQDLTHLIAFKPLAREFLTTMRNKHKRLVLVTNAHAKSLAIKLEHTLLDRYLDKIISAHEIGLPKENPLFWEKLLHIETFDKDHTLLIDDNISALESAKDFGIQYQLAVTHPSSKDGPVDTGKFMAMTDFSELID
jgi:putative hydrolase of the HAD superfamily